MKVVLDGGDVVELGETEANVTIGITDYSRRETDDFGVTSVVERGFARRMATRLQVPFAGTDALQRQLVDLRATPARWVADDRFAWLDFRGIYRDFEIDLAVPPMSYCSLSVDGLADTEVAADPGGDPAPDGRPSTLTLLQPVPVTGGMLTATNIAQTDYPEWSSGTNYAAGARVIKSATDLIYESAVPANQGNDPAGASGKWITVGATNRWAMFDEALGSRSSWAGSIAVTIAPGRTIDALALLDGTAATVRVQVGVYDQTRTVANGSIVFADLPATSASITVTITGPGTVQVGTLMIGRMRRLGITEASPTAGITDFSRKEEDEFGEVTVVQRAWQKRMTAKALIRTDALDLVANRIASVRARPSLWLGEAGSDVLTVYGFFKDFSIEVGENVSKLSLSIEGLSTAAKLEPLSASVAWPDVRDPDNTKPEDNATDGATIGENVRNQDGSIYIPTGGDFDPSDIYSSLNAIEGDLTSTRADLLAATSALALTSAAVTETQTQIRLRPNLQHNGGFSLGTSGLSGLPASATIVRDNPQWGTFFRHEETGSVAVTMQPINVVTSTTYTVSFEASLQASAGIVYVDVVYWSGAGATGTSTFPSIGASRAVPAEFSDTRQAFSFTVPAGVASVQLRLGTYGVSNATRTAFRRVKLERGNLPASLWSDEATVNDIDASIRQVDTARANDTAASATRFVSVESRVTNTENVANSAYAGYLSTAGSLATTTAAQATFNSNVSTRLGAAESGVGSNTTAISGLSASLSGYQTTVNARFATNEGNITTAQTAAASAQSAVTTLDQTMTARLRNGAPNLLRNSDFTDGLNGWTVDGSGWSVVTGFAIGPFAQNSGNPGFLRQDVQAQAGTSYSLSAEMDPDVVGHIRVYIDWLNSSGGVIGSAFNLFGGGWFRVSAPSTLAPAGTVAARIRIQQTGANTGRLTRVQFQQGAPTDYRADQSLIMLYATVAQHAGTLVDLSGRAQAYWQIVAQVPGQRTQLTISADSGGGGGVDIVGNVRITGNLIVAGSLAFEKLAYGSLGRCSIYSHQTGFDLSGTGWTSFMGVGVTPQEGNPTAITFSYVSETVSGTDADIYVRVIRVSDGTAIWGGPNGEKTKATQMGSAILFDSTSPGSRQQYDVQGRAPGGNTVRFRMRNMYPVEIGRQAIEEIQIIAASANAGPGAGAQGGGNVNGSMSTDPGGGAYSTSNPNPGRSGLYRYNQFQP